MNHMITSYREYLDAYLLYQRGKGDVLDDQQHAPDETLALRCIAAHDVTAGNAPRSRVELEVAIDRLME